MCAVARRMGLAEFALAMPLIIMLLIVARCLAETIQLKRRSVL
ncbi:hypothetical protein NAL19_2802 [Pectobacterium sp. F1-1]|nr:hypothetical protein NAL19_2802 [Pectobacterium sp. F1-1]